MINPKRELFRWGPIDCKIAYIDAFMEGMGGLKGEVGINWPDTINHVKDDKTLVIVDYEDLYSAGEKVFKKCIMDDKKKRFYYNKWFKLSKKLLKSYNSIKGKQLSRLSDNGLSESLNRFYKLVSDFWAVGLIPEIANWGGERILKNLLNKYPKENFTEIFEALSAPEDLSFYQVEERDLLNIKLLKDKKEEALLKHFEDYAWINNSYGGLASLSIGDFKKRIKDIDLEKAKSKIREIEDFTKKTKEKKKDIISRFKISKNIQEVASKLIFSIWWQDFRKKFIFMALHVIGEFEKELCRRHNIKFKDIEFYRPRDLKILADKGIKVDNIKERKKGYISYYHEKENKLIYLFGDEANNLASKYSSFEFDKNINEFKGIVVSKGKARGRARILSGARHFDSMKEGEILIASMTSPEYIVAMRKASAIITDEGGMTCHAAIVSRELGLPCVIGTKISTRVLKDGDLVEVRADHALVKIIKRKK